MKSPNCIEVTSGEDVTIIFDAIPDPKPRIVNIIPPERWLAILIDAGEYDLAKEVRQEIYQKLSAQKDTDQKGNEKQERP